MPSNSTPSPTRSHAKAVAPYDARSPRQKTSKIWDHGIALDSQDNIVDENSTTAAKYRCRHCSEIFKGNEHKNIREHLKNRHMVTFVKGQKRTSNTASTTTLRLPSPQDIQTTEIEELPFVVDSKVVENRIAQWTTMTRQPFTAVTEPTFHAMMDSLNRNASSVLPLSSNTVRAHIIKWFNQSMVPVATKIRQSMGNVHIQFDMGRTPNIKSYLTVIATFANTNYDIVQIPITLREITTNHDGKALGKVVYEVIKQYGISSKLGHFVLDNVESNDYAVSEVTARVYQEHNIYLRPREVRIRCSNHVIHLGMKALLLGVKAATVSEVNRDFAIREDEGGDVMVGAGTQIRENTRPGPVERLSDLVEQIRTSTIEKNRFRQIPGEVEQSDQLLELLNGNETRWSSVYNMIGRAVRLKTRVDRYIQLARGSGRQQCPSLTEQDWRDLSILHQLMTPIQTLVTSLQARQTTLETVFPSFDELLCSLDRIQRTNSYGPTIQFGAARCYAKLHYYLYDIMDKESDAYFLAVILDPSQKLHYFSRTCKPERLTELQSRLERALERFVKTQGLVGTAGEIVTYELEVYLSEKVCERSKGFRPLLKWIELKTRFPTLAVWALQILTIPASSAEAERVFSGYITPIFIRG